MRARGDRRRRLLAAALIAVICVAYLPALRGDFIWDDDGYVSVNPTLRSTAGLTAIWLDPTATPQYYPLVHTSYWLEYHVWGLEPAGYHVTNLALHIIAAFLLWRVLVFLAIPAAWLIAAIFAVHPVQVESVAWITERKNVLSGVFFFAAMLTYLQLALDPITRSPQRRRRLYVWTWVLFVGALFSKSVTATLPGALLLIVAWKRGRLHWSDVGPLLPLFAVGAAMGAVTAWLERTHVGAHGIDWQLSVAQRIVIAGHALWFYAGKLIWPTNLTFIYPRWHVNAADPRQLVFPLAAVAVFVGLWLARRTLGSGPLVAVLLFAGTLFPALGFVDTFPMRYSFVADHFQYLASIALMTLAVATPAHMLRAFEGRRARVGVTVGMGLILVMAALTWRQSHVYANQEMLWTDTIRKDPASWMGHTSLGAVLGQRGAIAEAELQYRQAVQLNPDFVIARIDLAGLLANQGRIADAIPQYRAAVRLDPDTLSNYVSLAGALLYGGQVDEAVSCLRAAVERWPDEVDVRRYLNMALNSQRQPRTEGGPRPSKP